MDVLSTARRSATRALLSTVACTAALLVGAVAGTPLPVAAQTGGSAAASAAAEPIKVVYHLTEGLPQASRAINNIRNHLAADPTAKIVVVAHGLGIDFLLDGAASSSGQAYAGAIGDLASKGIEFRVCNNTLVSRNIDPGKLVMEAKIVPSGVAETARLQARERFAYLRP